jgi:hypothetical protein
VGDGAPAVEATADPEDEVGEGEVGDELPVADERVEAVTVKIVKLAIAEGQEQIGMTLTRERR